MDADTWAETMTARLMEWHRAATSPEMRKAAIEKAYQEAHEEGFRQGKREGAMRIVSRLLTFRFGPMSSSVEDRLRRVPFEELADIAVSVFIVNSLAELGLE